MPKRTKRTTPLRRRRSPVRVPESLKSIRLEAIADGWANLDAADSESEDDKPKLPRFKMMAYGGGVMRPQLTGIGYFGRGVVLDLSGWKFQAGQSAVNWQHNRYDPVGHIEKHEITSRVTCEGVLSIPGESRDKIVEGAAGGYQWRVSVEGSPDLDKAEQVSADESIQVNGRRLRGPFLLLRSGVFTGVGFVTNAGDGQAKATVSADLISPPGTESETMEFAEFLKACGVDESKASKEQLATLQAAYDAQYGAVDDDDDGEAEIDAGEGDPQPKPTKKPAKKPAPAKIEAGEGFDIEAHNEAIAANAERVQAIQNLIAAKGDIEIDFKGEKVSLCAHAIRTGMDAKDVELELYRNSAPRGPAIHSHEASDTVNVNAMTGAILLNAGLALDDKAFRDPAAVSMGIPAHMRAGLNEDNRQKALEAAHRYGDPNLRDIARDCLRLEGKAAPRSVDALIEAAASSATLNQVYQATIGAALLIGFKEAARTLDRWSGVETVEDFKEVQRFTEDLAETLGYLPPDGEADHTTTGATFETLSLDSYAKQFEIGYHAYRNNNLGLLSRMPFKMGQAAYRTEENLGYAVLLSNPTMKSTGRQLFNTTDGTAHVKPLTHDNASFLIAAMASQTLGDATLDLMAKWALVPPQLLDKARQVYRSPMIGEDDGQGTINTVAEHGVMPMSSARLGNGTTHPKTKAFHAGSQTTHYLLADGVEIAARVYLTGRNAAPMVRVTQLTQGRWGTHVDVKHEVGFGFLTTKGIFRATAT